MQEQKMALDNMIYKIRTGSILYGTHTEMSDDDFSGIFIPNKEYLLGIKRIEQVELSTHTSQQIRNTKGDVDYVIYALPKFIQLSVGNNPNIIEQFYIPDNCVLYTSNLAIELIKNRDLFLSKKVYHTFKGYAYSQRQKLDTKRENMSGRKELIEKYGYDVKFASHLVRILFECLELLVEKNLHFPLSQNNLIRDIKLGKYELSWVLNKATELEQLIDQAYITSDLQYSPNIEKINELQMYLLETFLKK